MKKIIIIFILMAFFPLKVSANTNYKTLLNNVDTIQLNKYWHHFMDKWSYIPNTTNIVHL